MCTNTKLKVIKLKQHQKVVFDAVLFNSLYQISYIAFLEISISLSLLNTNSVVFLILVRQSLPSSLFQICR